MILPCYILQLFELLESVEGKYKPYYDSLEAALMSRPKIMLCLQEMWYFVCCKHD